MQEISNTLFTIQGFNISLTDIASIATSISVIIAIFQLIAARKIRQETARRDAVKEAVDIAKVFQSDILDNISFTLAVYHKIGLSSFIDKKLPSDRLLRFTREEARVLLGGDCTDLYKEYENRVNAKVLDSAAYGHAKYQIKMRNIEASDKDANNRENTNRDKEIDGRNKMMKFFSAREDAINKLEWIAMLINSHAAEGTVIYQSLHQSICLFVRTNYLFISSQNTDTNVCDKYYSNIIDLYNAWMCASRKKQKINDKILKKWERKTARLQAQNEKERSRSLVKGPKM